MTMNAHEVAKVLGISERSVWTYTKKGLIPSFHLGNRVLYSVKAIQELIEKRELGKLRVSYGNVAIAV
jgi:DNA-binding transcriptional MerR regulator